MLRRFWRFAFRLLYHELAFSYDRVSRLVSQGQWRAWQRTTLAYLPPADDCLALELAHGTGDLQLDLLRRGYRTVALDLSPHMGRLARGKLRRAGHSANLIRGDALRLPFADACLNAIVCTFPTGFILSASAQAEMARVLRADGAAVVLLAGRLHGQGPAKALIRLLYRLSGQSDALLSDDAVSQIFAAGGLSAKSRLVQLEGSSAQLVILSPIRAAASLASDMALESRDELC